VALRVRAAVLAEAEGEVGRLVSYRGAGGDRALVVRIHIVDERMDGRGRSDRGRIAKARRRLAEIDPPAVGRPLIRCDWS
jgi:hypothetical protein